MSLLVLYYCRNKRNTYKKKTQLVKESFHMHFIQFRVNDVFQFASVQYT